MGILGVFWSDKWEKFPAVLECWTVFEHVWCLVTKVSYRVPDNCNVFQAEVQCFM